jgi:hypothetical protein
VPRTYPGAALAAIVVFVATATVASAAPSASHLYRTPPTRACLIRHGARLQPAKAASRDQIDWILFRRIPNLGTNLVDVRLYFAPTAAGAIVLQRAAELAGAQVRPRVIRRRNVLVLQNILGRGLTRTQKTMMLACLR